MANKQLDEFDKEAEREGKALTTMQRTGNVQRPIVRKTYKVDGLTYWTNFKHRKIDTRH